MKKISVIIFCVLISYTNVFGQRSLLFLNTKTNKTIEVSLGQTLSIQYIGYNNQIYHFKNIVSDLNDSVIVLGNPTGNLPLWVQKLNKNYEPNYKIVNIKDIVSFRKITPGRLLAKSLITTSVSFGTFLLSYNLFRDAGTTPLNSILISIGLGATSSVLNAFILPDNPNNKISDNWVISTRN